MNFSKPAPYNQHVYQGWGADQGRSRENFTTPVPNPIPIPNPNANPKP